MLPYLNLVFIFTERPILHSDNITRETFNVSEYNNQQKTSTHPGKKTTFILCLTEVLRGIMLHFFLLKFSLLPELFDDGDHTRALNDSEGKNVTDGWIKLLRGH